MEEVNFAEVVANVAILKLTKLETFMDELVSEKKEKLKFMDEMKIANDLDKMFENCMNCAIKEAERSYERMQFRQALSDGFHQLENAKNFYVNHMRNNKEKYGGISYELMEKYMEVQLKLLTPITPHFCEHMAHILFFLFFLRKILKSAKREALVGSACFFMLRKAKNARLFQPYVAKII